MQTFSSILQDKIRSHNESWQSFYINLKSDLCEKCLTKRFGTTLQTAMSPTLKILPWKKKRHKSNLGFFGNHTKPDDLQLFYGNRDDGVKVLLECKLMHDSGNYDVRNGFSQLLEYLLEGKWQEGCLVIFDQRKSGGELFLHEGSSDADEYKKLNTWFANKFSLADCPVVPLQNITISIVRLYEKDGHLDAEVFRISGPSDSQDANSEGETTAPPH